jgi:transcriptional regulator GlxA family with amidase domain
MPQRTVGILIFDDVEVLDFCGPFEVFATTIMPGADPLQGEEPPFRVFTIAERPATITCRGGLLVQPHYTLEDHPPLNILIVPGGYGTRREVNNPRLLDWIARQSHSTELTTSVCTGAFLLAARGLLDGMPATTHWASIDRLRTTHPAVTVRDNVRYIDNGHILTSAGVSAGIDMSLHIVARLLGDEVANNTARRMEYASEWTVDEGRWTVDERRS